MSDWETNNATSYAEDKFFVHSRDRNKYKGSVKVIGMPENIIGEISAAVASQRYPYRTNADFVRDACVHRAHWLAENKDDPKLKGAVIKDMIEQSIHNKKESMDNEERAVNELIESLKRSDPVDIDDIVQDGRKYLDMMRWNKYKVQLKMELDRYRPDDDTY